MWFFFFCHKPSHASYIGCTLLMHANLAPESSNVKICFFPPLCARTRYVDTEWPSLWLDLNLELTYWLNGASNRGLAIGRSLGEGLRRNILNGHLQDNFQQSVREIVASRPLWHILSSFTHPRWPPTNLLTRLCDRLGDSAVGRATTAAMPAAVTP